ncbi:MAG TPA: GNAT family N-acetyltransferase [Acidimicrobiales bacterium]|nr:GNAT family N-acetyltransferase [Acidimicrobiales bacterium]
MEIRPIRSEELTEVGDLTVAAYAGVGHLDDESDYEVELRDVGSRARQAVVLVAVEPGAEGVVGAVTYVPDRASPYAEFDVEHAAGIRMLAVAPHAQGRGIGEALVLDCLGRAQADGRREVILHTTKAMAAAHRLYARLGFERDPNLDWWPTPGIELIGFRKHLSPNP